MCWLWLSAAKNVVKDVRLLVADLIWNDRTAWSERLSIAGSAADASSNAHSSLLQTESG